MAHAATKQLQSRLDREDARNVLVRGASAPSRSPATVTVVPGTTARVTPDRRYAPLFVTAEAQSGRSIRRYRGCDASEAAEAAVELVEERDPRSVWLCGREQIRSWWSDGVVRLLERRLATAARQADAQFVGWTAAEDDEVSDRYDVVFDS